MNTDRIITIAQVLLSVIYTAGYFTVLWSFLGGYVKPPLEWKETLISLITLLTAGEMMILQFWFLRARAASMPPPPPPDPLLVVNK